MEANKAGSAPKSFAGKLWAAGIVLLIAFAAVLVWQTLYSVPPKPWLVKWHISRYLKKQAGKHDFTVAFPFPSKAEMSMKVDDAKSLLSSANKGKKTGKEYETLKDLYFDLQTEAQILLQQLNERMSAGLTNGEASVKWVAEKKTALDAKNRALAPIIDDLWDFQRQYDTLVAIPDPKDTNQLAAARAMFIQEGHKKMDIATGYSGIYRVIGEELWVANRLLDSANVHYRRDGFSMARQACQDTLDYAQNGWLAARIVEGYIWPNLDLAEPSGNRRSPLSVENILNDSADVFREADETGNVMVGLQMLITKMPNSPRTDFAKMQLSQLYEDEGNLTKALYYMKEMKATNNLRNMRRITSLEQRVKTQR